MLIMMYFTILPLLIIFILMMLNLIIKKMNINNREKMSPFECGFDPFSSSRLPYSNQFYLIAIIFLIFDIEICIFLPIISYLYPKFNLIWSEMAMIFIMILIFGLYMEWYDGAFKWMK